jgi:HEAT repeat protein
LDLPQGKLPCIWFTLEWLQLQYSEGRFAKKCRFRTAAVDLPAGAVGLALRQKFGKSTRFTIKSITGERKFMCRVKSGLLSALVGGLLLGGSVSVAMQPPVPGKKPPLPAGRPQLPKNKPALPGDNAEAPKADPAQLAALKPLLEKLASDDDDEQIAAIKELAKLGPAALPAMRPIVKAMQDDSGLVRAYAIMVLGSFGEAARPAAPFIAKAVVDEDRRVSRAALLALRRIKPDRSVTLPIIAQALANADPVTRVQALNTVAQMGEEAMPALLTALDHPEGKYWALLVLSEMGPKGKEALPKVTKLLTDESMEVQREAAMTLGMMGEAAKPAVPQIVKLLDDDDIPVRYAAAFALGALGPNAAAAVPALEKKLSGDDQQMQVTAAWALAKINAGDLTAQAKSIPIIVKGITNDDAMVRTASIRALMDLKPDPKKVFPAVKAALEKDPSLIDEVIEVLQEAGEAGMPVLLFALEKPESRGHAAHLLGRMGKGAAGAVKALVGALDDDNTEVRREVIFALGAIGPDAGSATPALVKLLESDNERVRHAATFALGKIGEGAKSAVDPLVKELASDDLFEQRIAAWALAHIDPANAAVAKDAVPILIGSLDSDDPVVRAAAAHALGNFGKLAAAATPTLGKIAAEDESEHVREVATAALKKIKG